MTLLTKSNIKFILTTSILSRILVILLQCISNLTLNDHKADAYRNRYHIVLSKHDLSSANSAASLLPSSYLQAYKAIEGFTKWDAQYFLEISLDGYVSEQHLAFLPLYPILISITRQLVFEHSRTINLEHITSASKQAHIQWRQSADLEVTVKDLEAYIQSSLVGVVLNNFLLFPLASLFLLLLTKVLSAGNEIYAKRVVGLFCFNPASIFFSTCYSESTFAALTFCAMFIIELRAKNYLSISGKNDDDDKKRATYQPVVLSQLNRLLSITLYAVAPLALATGTRSNGLINIGFLGYQLLLKYAPNPMKRTQQLAEQRGQSGLLASVCRIFEFIQDCLVLLMSSVLAASGYISFQIYSYIKFCTRPAAPSKQPPIGLMVPDWCSSTLPHAYGRVQAKYWNVGLFKYYELRQLPNFLLAAPITLLVMRGCLLESRLVAGARDKRLLAYYMQAVVLVLVCSLSINIQVITRLVASCCPAFYWLCARPNSRPKHSIIQAYFALYFLVGTVLHVNFLPWT